MIVMLENRLGLSALFSHKAPRLPNKLLGQTGFYIREKERQSLGLEV